MFESIHNVFIVGIKGVAMANIARILKQMGKNVSGSDTDEEFITDNLLITEKIPVSITFNPQAVPKDTDLVLYSAAHNGSKNPQVQAAKERGIKIMNQAVFIGELIKEFKTTVAVAGCHGKTTTSSLLAYALNRLGKTPSYLVGTPTFEEYFGGAYESKDVFILEADEYGVEPPIDKTPKFHFFDPQFLIVTNIDFDHPDVYRNLDETKKSFLKFMKKIDGEGVIMACADDAPLQEVLKEIPRERYILYGFHKNADVQIVNSHVENEGMTWEIKSKSLKNFESKKFHISLFGEKNVLNATAVVVILSRLGHKPEEIITAIADFHGAKRRLEHLASIAGNELFDDYAHHPAEIEATISALKLRFIGKKIIVLFQPHTYSRTAILKEEFVEALSKADEALILPIFASAREESGTDGIRSIDLMHLAKKKNIHTIHGYDSNDSALMDLPGFLSKNNVICTMGAGDIYELRDKLDKILEKSVSSI